MGTVATPRTGHKNGFDVVAEPFAQSEGLLFADVLNAESIERVFREEKALYGLRWNVELDIRSIKQALGLDPVRCKTPGMVHRELWVTLLAYNVIRKVIATSAAIHGKQPRGLGFALACQTILSSWMLVSTGSCSNAHAISCERN